MKTLLLILTIVLFSCKKDDYKCQCSYTYTYVKPGEPYVVTPPSGPSYTVMGNPTTVTENKQSTTVYKTTKGNAKDLCVDRKETAGGITSEYTGCKLR